MGNTNKIEPSVKPIIAYGNSVLRNTCKNVSKDEQGLTILINDLWNTLELTGGVGLAAPQINSSKKVFVVNSKLVYDGSSERQRQNIFSGDKGIKETFINAKLIATSDESWSEMEGCLSIPGITEPVNRACVIRVEYQDAHFNLKRTVFSGYTAKVIQHEYDHINGILFIDRLQLTAKNQIKDRLVMVEKGKIETAYPIQYKKD